MAEVNVYSQEGCGPCTDAKAHLRDLNVKFSECDIRNSAKCNFEFLQLGGTGTPLITVGEDKLEGYDPNALDQLLKQHGLI